LRVVTGPQDDHFTDKGKESFLSGEYTVSVESDRMGYRLEGPTIQHSRGADIISDGIPLGAVQVPGHGFPIIMLADCQTTGGYAKIATVISADIAKIAQLKPGEKIRFRSVSVNEAVESLRQHEQNIRQVGTKIDTETEEHQTYDVYVDGRRLRLHIKKAH
jgi:allophanate hydrolase subunit 2